MTLVDIYFAGVIYDHLQDTARRSEKSQRLKMAEICKPYTPRTAARAVKRLLDTDPPALIVKSPGNGQRHGTLYGFPPR